MMPWGAGGMLTQVGLTTPPDLASGYGAGQGTLSPTTRVKAQTQPTRAIAETKSGGAMPPEGPAACGGQQVNP